MIIVMTFGQSLWLVEYEELTAKALCKVGNVGSFREMMSENKYNQIVNNLNELMMRVKDLPANVNLNGAKIKTPNGVIGFVISEFDQGIMLSMYPLKEYNKLGEDNLAEKRLYPQIIDNKESMKEWEIIVDHTVKCNCDSLVGHEHIMNV